MGCDHYMVPAGIVPGPHEHYHLIETCRFCRGWYRRPLYPENRINAEGLV